MNVILKDCFDTTDVNTKVVVDEVEKCVNGVKLMIFVGCRYF